MTRAVITTTITIVALTTPTAIAGLIPPVDPLCSCHDHSHENHAMHEHAGIDVSSLNIIGACFGYADLRDAELVRVFANGANFHAARMSGADLRSAHLDDANLREVVAIGVNLAGAFLIDADATGIDLSFASLAGADLRGARFVDADLSDTNFVGANVVGADFSGADLTNAKFLDSTTSDATTLYDVDTIFTAFDPVAAGWTLSRAACCIAGNCAITDQTTCTTLGGAYLGTETSCVAACAQACPSDLDLGGSVGFEDLLLLLSDWGPCP